MILDDATDAFQDASAFLFSFVTPYTALPTLYKQKLNSQISTSGRSLSFGATDMLLAHSETHINVLSTLGASYFDNGYGAHGLFGANQRPVDELEIFVIEAPFCAATCFGLPAQHAQVCNGHGVCNPPNNCTCNPGFSGATCNSLGCFNYTSESPAVCNYRYVPTILTNC